MKSLAKKTANSYLVSEQVEKSEVRLWRVVARSQEQAIDLVNEGKANLIGLINSTSSHIYRQDYKA